MTSQQPERYASTWERLKGSFGSKADRAKIKERPGLDWQDFTTDLAGDILPIAGSVIGAPLGIFGMGAGAAAGEAARRSIGKNAFGLQQDQSLGQHLKGIATEGVITAGTAGAFKLAGGAVKSFAKLAPKVSKFTTGQPEEAFQRISKSKTAQEWLTGNQTWDDLIAQVKKGAEKVGVSDPKAVFGEAIKTINESAPKDTRMILSAVKKEMAKRGFAVTRDSATKQYIVKAIEGGSGKSTARFSRRFSNAVKRILDEPVISHGSATSTEIDAFLSRIGDETAKLLAKNDKSGARAMNTILAVLRSSAEKRLPKELVVANKAYKDTELLAKAVRNLLGPSARGSLTGEQQDKIFRGITSLFRPSAGGKQATIDTFEKLSGVPVRDALAGLTLRQVEPQVIRGLSAVGGGFGGAMALGGGIVGPLASGVAGLAATSPYAMARLNMLAGKAAPAVGRLGARYGLPATLSTAEVLRRALNR
jgi:hypothetical protein